MWGTLLFGPAAALSVGEWIGWYAGALDAWPITVARVVRGPKIMVDGPLQDWLFHAAQKHFEVQPSSKTLWTLEDRPILQARGLAHKV